jgi:(p)ppGpp synthase/HD superfamily hydrolase
MTTLTPIERIDRARCFAAERYARANMLPELHEHIERVAWLTSYHGHAEALEPEELTCIVMAAWLHDMVEDHLASMDEIVVHFPARVVELVTALTAPKGSRREREEVYLRQLVEGGPSTILIKVCDRVCNVERCWVNRDTRLFMYRREHTAFRQALHREGYILALWDRLDQALGWTEPTPKKKPMQIDAIDEAVRRARADGKYDI